MTSLDLGEAEDDMTVVVVSFEGGELDRTPPEVIHVSWHQHELGAIGAGPARPNEDERSGKRPCRPGLWRSSAC